MAPVKSSVTTVASVVRSPSARSASSSSSRRMAFWFCSFCSWVSRSRRCEAWYSAKPMSMMLTMIAIRITYAHMGVTM